MSKRRTSPETKAKTAARKRGKRALGRLVPDEGDRDDYAETLTRYVDAIGLVAKLRAEWAELGEPTLTEGSMRQTIPHPHIKMIQAAEDAARRNAEDLGLIPTSKGARPAGGRPKGAESSPDRKAEPPKLRVAK